MTKVEWDDSLSVGIDLIDEQHRGLIGRINELSEAVENNLGQAEISKTLDYLIDYTDFHFTAEEGHMSDHDYSGLEEQVVQHGEFVKTLNNLVEDFEEDGATEPLSEAINTFLGNWLIGHIKDVDIRFGRFLEEKGIDLVQ
jgi:hemerythrin